MKLIVLIISSHSNENDCHNDFKIRQSKYLDMFSDRLKYFFVEMKENIETDYFHGNHIFVKGIESGIPGIITKTCRAIKLINDMHVYDVLLRTNLSTFFNIPLLFNFINEFPKHDVYSGFQVFDFVTGSGIFMTKGASTMLMNNYLHFNVANEQDDVLIAKCLKQNGVSYFSPNPKYMWCQMIDEPQFIHVEHTIANYSTDVIIYDNVMQYRFKTKSRERDVECVDVLLSKLYGYDFTHFMRHSFPLKNATKDGVLNEKMCKTTEQSSQTKLIILMISSPSTENHCYEDFKVRQSKYLDIFTDQLKYYFVEMKENIKEDYMDGNHIFIKGIESLIPGVMIKTCKAIKMINDRHDYKVLLRTNLSTFFNIPVVFDFIDDFPQCDVYAGFNMTQIRCTLAINGDYKLRDFVPGTNIFMTKQATQLLIDNHSFFDINEPADDVLISHCMKFSQVPFFSPVPKYYCYHIILQQIIELFENIEYVFTDGISFNGFEIKNKDKTMFFRIKNYPREFDIKCFDWLLKEIYNL